MISHSRDTRLMIMKLAAFGAAALWILPLNASAEVDKNFHVIKGRPSSKVVTESSWPTRYELDKEQQLDHVLVITQTDGQFQWTSKENKPLQHTVTGIYDNFIGANDSSYVKILKEKNSCSYMEHLNFHFKTVTYFGDCEVESEPGTPGTGG